MTDRITHDEADLASVRALSEGDATDAWGIVHDYIAQQRAAAAWQPIATAPKDGTHVLLLTPLLHELVVGLWSSGRNLWADGSGRALICGTDGVPTHWMPLPAAPEKP